MIKDVIEFLNDSLEDTGYFDQRFGLCELVQRSDGQISPKQYCGKGEWKEVSNFDSYNGVSYFRKTGDTGIELLEPDDATASLIACEDTNVFTFPLKLVGCIPRKKLKTDDAYSDDRTVNSLIAAVQADTSGLATLLQARTIYITADSYTTNNQAILSEEYTNISPNDINYNFIYFAINITVEVNILTSCIITEC